MGMKICEYCGGEMDCRFVKNFRFTQRMCEDEKLIPVEIFIPDAEVYTCKECGNTIAGGYADAGESDRNVIFSIEMELDE